MKAWQRLTTAARRPRTRMVVAVTFLAAAMGPLVGWNSARADSGASDYLLIQTTGSASDVNIQVSGTVHQSAAGTLVAGYGYGLDLSGHTGGDVEAADVSNSVGLSLGASPGISAERLTVSSPVALEYPFTAGIELKAPAMNTGDKLDLLIFFPNGTIDSSSVTATAATGTVSTNLIFGSGAQTLDVADQGDGGTAVAVNGVAQGTNSHTANPSAGIVGTIISNCSACSGTWQSPNGTPTWWRVPAGSPIPGCPGCLTFHQFVGPAGTWTWTWAGQQSNLNNSSADYGAYVPIGDDWSIFRSPDFD